MIMNWFSSETTQQRYTDYWNDYAAQFSKDRNQQSQDFDKVRFVVFDTETTGFQLNTDRVLSIGAVCVTNGSILVNSSFEHFVQQEQFNEKTVEIHGILHHDQRAELSEKQLLEKWLKYIGNSILVAHHAQFDIEMMNQMLRRHDLPKLKNQVLDTAKLYTATKSKTNIRTIDASLDAIAEEYHLDVSDRHTAAGDALLSALVFLQTTSILRYQKGISLSKMLKRYS